MQISPAKPHFSLHRYRFYLAKGREHLVTEVCKQSRYYEIAFGFVDREIQVDNFEKLMRKLSRVRVDRFRDIACEPSLRLIEAARRGYEAVGLDSNPQMLEYLERKA